MDKASLEVVSSDGKVEVNAILNLEKDTAFEDMNVPQQVVYALSEVLNNVKHPDLIHYLAEAVNDGNIIQFAGVVKGIHKRREQEEK